MFKFIRDALSEFDHVVWPTPNETRKYMYYNIAVIAVLTVFLMSLGYVIQESLTAARKSIPHDAVVIENSDTVPQADLDAIEAALAKKQAQSGSTNTGVTVTVQTGAVQ
jgi:preprotein translocase SecE subunit